MDIKSLMVGDWVYNKHHRKNIRLTQYDFFTHTHNEFGEQELAPFAKPTIGRDLEPIPLEKIHLTKNGFEVTRNMSSSGNKDVWSLRVSKNKMFHIIEHHNKRKFPYFWIELGSNSDIKYVHQLQHALRLCGIEKEIEL